METLQLKNSQNIDDTLGRDCCPAWGVGGQEFCEWSSEQSVLVCVSEADHHV